ncbi:MAG: copper chaperone PCu(A)C [Oceanicaulis sp.]
MKTLIKVAAALVLSVAGLAASLAHDYTVGDLVIKHPWARPTVTDRTPGAAYFVVHNTGEEADRLVAVHPDPAFAGRAELHTHLFDDGVARMRRVDGGILIPAGETVALEPGGLHVMLYELTGPLEVGVLRKLTLEFEHSGSVDVWVLVQSPDMDAAHAH